MIHYEDYEREALKDQIYKQDLLNEVCILSGEEITSNSKETVKIKEKDEKTIQPEILPF